MLGGRFADGGSQGPLYACAALLCVVAIACGGSSAGAAFRLAVVELCALPALALALLAARRERRIDWGAGVLALIAAAPLLQLVPVPPDIWSRLPGGSARAEALALAGVAPPWAPLSLFPGATLGCVLALVGPAAAFLAVSQLSMSRRRTLCALWLAGACVGLALGTIQLAQPDGGWAYPYAGANLGSLVGLFANRNHQAGWLLALTPVAAALTAPALRNGGSPMRQGVATAAGLFGVVSLVALGVVRSRAGILLAGPAALGALAVLARAGVRWRRLALGALAALAAGLVVAIFAAGPILDRFAPQARPEARADTWPMVLAAAQNAMPLGAGVGAFDRVFRAAEPLDLVGPAFLNHAHNDYLEVWLETGVAGIALLTLFLVWFCLRAARAWGPGGSDLARASSVAVVLLLAQSAVDYPLRTETLACLFAFACGCLTPAGQTAEAAS
jgi:O-antigen ligase